MSEEKTDITIDSPLQLRCGLVLKNRIAKAAMTECLADEYSRPTKELCRLYETWSKGGAGLLITGNIQVDRRYLERPGNVCIDGKQTDEQIRLLKEYAKSGKHNNTKIFAQISHAGRQSNGLVNMSPVGPSDIALQNVPKQLFGKPRAMTLDEIQNLKERFIYAVNVCIECGFDGVQIHAAHGYLLSSFMNPLANNRTDKYGGSLENRSRLLMEIVSEVKEKCIKDRKFALCVKLNSADYQNGGFTTDESLIVAKKLANIIDILEISGGNYDSSIFRENELLLEDDDKLHAKLDNIISKHDLKKSTALREAYYLKYSRDIINVVKKDLDNCDMKIMCTGGFRSKQIIIQSLSTNGTDLIGIGRPLCGNPNAINDLLNSKNDNYCLERYEGRIKFGFFLSFLNSVWLQRKIKFIGLVNIAAKQSWYYTQIINIAKYGQSNTNVSIFKAIQINMNQENGCARNLVGIKAAGNIYNKGGDPNKPPMTKPKETNSNALKFVLLAGSALIVLVSYVLYKKYQSK